MGEKYFGGEKADGLGFILPVRGVCVAVQLESAGLGKNFCCGCPDCLLTNGLTLCWHAIDVDDGLAPDMRRKRLVPIQRILAFGLFQYVVPDYLQVIREVAAHSETLGDPSGN